MACSLADFRFPAVRPAGSPPRVGLPRLVWCQGGFQSPDGRRSPACLRGDRGCRFHRWEVRPPPAGHRAWCRCPDGFRFLVWWTDGPRARWMVCSGWADWPVWWLAGSLHCLRFRPRVWLRAGRVWWPVYGAASARVWWPVCQGGWRKAWWPACWMMGERVWRRSHHLKRAGLLKACCWMAAGKTSCRCCLPKAWNRIGSPHRPHHLPLVRRPHHHGTHRLRHGQKYPWLPIQEL